MSTVPSQHPASSPARAASSSGARCPWWLTQPGTHRVVHLQGKLDLAVKFLKLLFHRGLWSSEKRQVGASGGEHPTAWSPEALPPKGVWFPLVSPKLNAAPGVALKRTGWGVPQREGDACREAVPTHPVNTSQHGAGITAAPAGPKQKRSLLERSFPSTGEAAPAPFYLCSPATCHHSPRPLTLFLLHSPFGDQLRLLAASFHLQRSAGGKGTRCDQAGDACR